jgi:hypothetical protein
MRLRATRSTDEQRPRATSTARTMRWSEDAGGREENAGVPLRLSVLLRWL